MCGRLARKPRHARRTDRSHVGLVGEQGQATGRPFHAAAKL
jgi:hypothetical protein